MKIDTKNNSQTNTYTLTHTHKYTYTYINKRINRNKFSLTHADSFTNIITTHRHI